MKLARLTLIQTKMMDIKIATLNLCLGLKNKRCEVERLMIGNNIDILCLQEVEIDKDYDYHALNLNNYCLEIEHNTIKSRVGMFVGNNVNYTRMHQLEGIDSHVIIIDIVNSCTIKRIINVYRCFNPQGNINARDKFIYQLEIIKNAFIDKCVVLGDFNLDYEKVYDDNYAHKLLFEDFEITLSMCNLVQIVNFVTWSRLVGVTLKSSTLDLMCNRLTVLNQQINLNW